MNFREAMARYGAGDDLEWYNEYDRVWVQYVPTCDQTQFRVKPKKQYQVLYKTGTRYQLTDNTFTSKEDFESKVPWLTFIKLVMETEQ